jgi:hypothetical protein
MRYIKSFNEELTPYVYRNAANLAKQYKQPKRAERFTNWANELTNRENIKKTEENRERLSQYGSFDGCLSVGYNDEDIVGKFYLDIWFDDDWFRDIVYQSWGDGAFEYGISLPFEIEIIAADEETQGKIDATEVQQNHGVIWSNRLEMNLSTYDQTTKEVNLKANGYGYYPRDTEDFHFLDRRNAVKFKKLLVDALDGKNSFGCSNSYVKFDTLKDHIKTTLVEISNNERLVDCPLDVSIYDDFDIFQKTMDVQGLNIKYIDNYLIKQNNSKGVH